ncbi:MAG: xanthine dehydrogenase family protein molybdopterin-binding subunit [Lachnospiraceae bacterium]|jgi:CO/xanthine dehydrogenase Mo-binding subunit
MREKALRYVGVSMSNDNAYGKVTGKVQYCGDLSAPGQLHMKIKGSEIAHGKVIQVDDAEAWKVPGVKAVYSCFNTPDTLYDRGRVAAYEGGAFQERLFDAHIRFMGERVAAVVADTVEHAEEACRKIKVEYETYPMAATMEAACKEDAPKIHETGNVQELDVVSCGDYDACEAELVHKSHTSWGRITHLSMETHTTRALYEKGANKLTVWTGCQTVFGIRSTLGDLLGMPYSKVRVIKTTMGGSFGCKQETITEPLAAYAAKDLEADVMLAYTREEQINNSMLKHSVKTEVESKVHPDGTIEGLKVRMMMDAGAYLTVSPSLAQKVGKKLGKVYRIPNIYYDGKVVCTNTAVNGSFRSWGSVEAALIYENHWNQVAEELHMDPVEFRLKNVHEAYELEPMYKVTVGNTHFKECLIRGRDAFRWEERRKACEEKNKKGGRYRYGAGMALASHTSSFYPYGADMANAVARIQDDGSLLVHVGVHDHGCGTVMAMKKIAAEVMEIDLEKVELKEADTDVSMYDYGCYASRTVYMLGQAVKKCCEDLKEQARHMAAIKMQCNYSVLQYEDGVFIKEDEPDKRMSLLETARYALGVMAEDLYAKATVHSRENPGVPAAHFTEVKVDTYSGMVEVVDCLSVHDVGKAVNPDMCIGQVGSGIQQGMGIALCEEIKIDPKTGKTLITNFKNYEVANAVDVPEYEALFIEEGNEFGPYGAKSIGEVVVVPVPPALVAAVNHALGTRLTDLPLTPSVILEALEKKEGEKA